MTLQAVSGYTYLMSASWSVAAPCVDVNYTLSIDGANLTVTSVFDVTFKDVVVANGTVTLKQALVIVLLATTLQGSLLVTAHTQAGSSPQVRWPGWSRISVLSVFTFREISKGYVYVSTEKKERRFCLH